MTTFRDVLTNISRRLTQVGELALLPATDVSAPGGAICDDDPVNPGQVRVEVVYYDPLSDAGLYREWGATAVAIEEAASGVSCTVAGNARTTDNTGKVTFDELPPDAPVDVELPRFTLTGAGRVHLSIHTECGRILTDDAGLPRTRRTFRCDPGASYKVRVWLRPKAIVLHWTAGNRRISQGNRRFYHFLVDGEAGWVLGSNVDNDPRFWRHNLVITGAGGVQGCNDVNIQLGTGLGAQRNVYAEWNEGRTEVLMRNVNGYAAHAGGFNTNSVGVSICAMAGSVDGGAINEATAVTNAQVQTCIAQVTRLCRAWHLDATDPNQLCTHFEVEHLHRGNPARKWDITWLPEEFQEAYRAAREQELCALPDEPYRHRRHVDVALDATFAQGRNTTDRVSAYLRESIAANI